MRFIALIDFEPRGGTYGAYFPQLPGCNAQAGSYEEVVDRAAENLSEWLADEAERGKTYVPEDLATFRARDEVKQALGDGDVLAFIPVLREEGRTIKANLSVDAGLLDAIDEAAKRRGVTRSSWLASAARAALKAAI